MGCDFIAIDFCQSDAELDVHYWLTLKEYSTYK